MRTPLEARLWAKIDRRGPDDCWPWLASKSKNGYGNIGKGGWHGGLVKAHRAVYELVIGPIPDGYVVDHTCHKKDSCSAGVDCPHRGCCNPAHLEAVTPAVNTERGNSGKSLRERTHCPRGHEYTEENTRRYQSGKYISRSCRACGRARARAAVARARGQLVAS